MRERRPGALVAIDALARFGNGAPATALPLAVNEVMQVRLDAVAGSSSAMTWRDCLRQNALRLILSAR